MNTSCLPAALAVTVCLAACGGGGDSTSSMRNPPATAPSSPSDDATATTPTAQGANAAEREADGSSAERRKREAAKRAAYERKRYGSPSPQSAPFARYSGKGRSKLHLAEFGEEAGGAQTAAAAAALSAYLQATGAGEWEEACSYLSASVRGQIAQLSQASGGSCGEALHKFVGGQGRLPGLGSGGIASLRIEEGGRAGDGAGFALFHGSDGADYWMAMKIENGAWRVISTAPQPFD